MARPLIYADFNNLGDAPHRLRLTCAGTKADLERLGLQLRDGLPLTLYTDDADDEGRTDNLLVDGTVQFSELENGWVAAVDWDTLRHESDAQPDNGAPASQRALTPEPGDSRG